MHDAVDSERRRRREAAVPDQLPTTPDLSERLRASSLLALPDDDFDDDDATITAGEAEEEASQ